MERALYAEDPKFASSLRGRDPRSNFRRRVLLAATAFVVGVVLLMLGLVTQLIVVSIGGFVLMLASAFFAVTSYRAVTAAAQLGVVDPSGVRRPAATSGGGRPQRRSAGPPPGGPPAPPPPAAAAAASAARPAAPASWPGWKSAGTAAATRTAAE